MLESASSDRADARSVLDGLVKERSETLRAIKDLHGALERAGVVQTKPAGADSQGADVRAGADGDKGFSALSLAVPATRSRPPPPSAQQSPRPSGTPDRAATPDRARDDFALPPPVSPERVRRVVSPQRAPLVLSAPPATRRTSPPALRSSAPPPGRASDFSAAPPQRDGLGLPSAPAELAPSPAATPAARGSPVVTTASSAPPARRAVAVPPAPRAVERRSLSFAASAEASAPRDGELGTAAEEMGREAALAAALRERVVRLQEGSSSVVPPASAAAPQLDRRELARQRIATAAAIGNRIASGRSEPPPGDRPNEMM
jgi:hypothetical protein